MRARTLAALAGAVLVVSTAHADSVWKAYIAKDHGFSFMAPGEVRAALGTYRGALAGPRQTIVYRSVDNNIEYRVMVMSFLQDLAASISLDERACGKSHFNGIAREMACWKSSKSVSRNS